MAQKSYGLYFCHRYCVYNFRFHAVHFVRQDSPGQWITNATCVSYGDEAIYQTIRHAYVGSNHKWLSKSNRNHVRHEVLPCGVAHSGWRFRWTSSHHVCSKTDAQFGKCVLRHASILWVDFMGSHFRIVQRQFVTTLIRILKNCSSKLLTISFKWKYSRICKRTVPPSLVGVIA